jgi:hypothetical protein
MIGRTASALLAGFLWLGSVPTSLTSEDKTALSQALSGLSLPISSFDQQVASIIAIQSVTLSIANSADPIPLSESREPADFIRWHRGACYDRSRFMEKALTYIGLQTRHVFVFETDERSPLLAFLSPRTSSHAMTEVNTSRGWMLIDPLSRWIGLTADGRALSADMLERDSKLVQSVWDARVKDSPNGILAHKFLDVNGLYSRHGRFYPPFTVVPNVSWTQLTGWLVGA